MLMKKYLFALICLCLSISVMAQLKSITGTVVDVKNEPVVGVSILEKGTSNGTITNLEGEFILKTGAESVLVVSYIGFKSQEIPVGDKAVLAIILQEDMEVLDEIVVVGYGTQKKSSMTASVASVSAKELTKQISSNVASTLQGRIPGVEILQNGGEAGSDISILIRGAGTFGSTEPLYIIDGAVSATGLNSLNPNDIESLEILKDASAAAIYGSRAANGVVLVTTKHGTVGAAKVEISGAFSYQTPSKVLDFMNADQWRQFANMVADNSPAYDYAKENVNPSNPGLSIDWQDLYYRNAPQWNLNAAISGGSEKSTFSTSIGYVKQEGIIIQSDYEKYNARVNGTYKKGIFSLQQNLSIAHSKKQMIPESRSILLPTLPVVDDLGRYVSTPAERGFSTTNIDIVNPLANVYARDNYIRKTDIIGSLSLGVDIFKGLKYRLNLAANYVNSHNYTHTPAYASAWDENGGADPRFSQPYTSLSEGRGENFNYTIDNLLTYNTTVNRHTFDALLGTSWMRDYLRILSADTGVNDLGAPTVTTYNGAGVIGSNEMSSILLSFFARLNYDYDNRYLLSLSIRSDESSKFAKGHRVGYFPSVSVGWNIHQEKFFEIPWISKLKVRGSYGELGANFIDPYSFVSLAFGPTPAIFGNKRQYGYVTRFAQQDLTWETTVSSNVALELGLFNNELTFSVEWFKKRNNDLLAPLEALPSSGQTVVINSSDVSYYNTASVENIGWEFNLGYRKAFGHFSFDAQANITFMKNEVIALGEGVQPIRSGLMSSRFNDRPSITQVGMPIGTFWGYQIAGTDDNGDFLYKGANGTLKNQSEMTPEDKTNLGKPNPDFTYGLNLNLGYKEWDLTAFFQGSYGNDIFAAAKYQFYFNYDNNNLTDALNSWTPDNMSDRLPIAKTDNYTGANALPSSFYVEDGSYFRCKNLQLGYTFNRRKLKEMGVFESIRLYAGIQNLFTITSYSLYDPEVSNNTLFDRGIDGIDSKSPAINSRTYNVGFNVIF